MEQHTKEWYDFRRQGIGASEASICLDINPWRKKYDLWLEKIGVKESNITNEAMKRGLQLEGPAREWASRELGLTFKPVVRKSRTTEFIFASLDGITEDNRAIEIKCPMKGLHETIPEHYYAQLQHQLYVIESDWMYYCSFDGSTGNILEVKRDDNYIKNLLQAEKTFWNCVINFIEPEHPIQYINRSDQEYINALMTYLNNKEKRILWESLEKQARDNLLSLTHQSTECCGVKITEKVRIGTVDYKQLTKDHNIDVNPYRKEAVKYYDIRESKDKE